VRSPDTVGERVEVIRRRDAFEHNTSAFMRKWNGQNTRIRKAIIAAREALTHTAMPDEVLEDCARLSLALGADGLRGELTLLKSARALAAYEKSQTVTRKHLRRVAPLALSHRLRRDPLDEAGSSTRVDRTVAETLG
ncbi:MAG: magnesium chelatase ATPase subunit I, partial [Pseudomonadota bacterium]